MKKVGYNYGRFVAYNEVMDIINKTNSIEEIKTYINKETEGFKNGRLGWEAVQSEADNNNRIGR